MNVRVWPANSSACPVCKTDDNKVLRFTRSRKFTKTKYQCAFCKTFYAHKIPVSKHPQGEI